LRREGFPQPYEALKALTRGKVHVGQKEIHAFIGGLDVPQAVKASLMALTPFNYTGVDS
jgi:adenylosuccinate lyase